MTPAELLLAELHAQTDGVTPTDIDGAARLVLDREHHPLLWQTLSQGERAVLRLAVSLAVGDLDRDLAALDVVWQERVCDSIRTTCFPREAAEAEERF